MTEAAERRVCGGRGEVLNKNKQRKMGPSCYPEWVKGTITQFDTVWWNPDVTLMRCGWSRCCRRSRAAECVSRWCIQALFQVSVAFILSPPNIPNSQCESWRNCSKQKRGVLVSANSSTQLPAKKRLFVQIHQGDGHISSVRRKKSPSPGFLFHLDFLFASFLVAELWMNKSFSGSQ